MQDISNLPLINGNRAFMLALPVLAQDPKSPTTKPAKKSDGKSKSKPKGKPKKAKKLKGLSGFEKAAIMRMRRFDKEIARALDGFLGLKDTKEKRIKCIDEEIESIADKRKAIRVARKSPFADMDRLDDVLDQLAQAEIDLGSIKKFYETGKLPQWFKDLRKQIEKAKKKQDKNIPTSKPAKKKTRARPDGLLELSDTLLVGLVLPNGDARV